VHYIPTDKINVHSTNSESLNSHSTTGNIDQLRHITNFCNKNTQDGCPSGKPGRVVQFVSDRG